MNNLVKNNDGELMTNSKVVFEHFNVSGGHRYIMKRISELIEKEPEFGAQHFFRSSYTSPQNKKISCYIISKDGFYFLCMGFTGKKAAKWKESFIKAFNSGRFVIRAFLASHSMRVLNR